MARVLQPLRLLATAVLVLLLVVPTATATTVRVHLHKAAATPQPSSNSSQQLSCGAAFTRNPQQPPVLSTTCPSVCGESNFCVLYPSSAKGLCSERYGLSSCYDGDVCSFECLTAWGNANSWFITVYDSSDDVFTTLDVQNSAFAVPSVLVNASVVTKLDGFDRPSVITQITFMGNELASALLEENGGHDDIFDRGKVVKFTFPANFLRQLQGADYIRIENVAFPPTAGADDLVFKKLLNLYASNTLVKGMPIPAKSMPLIESLDLSYNYIETLNKGTLPSRLKQLLLDMNFLRQVPEDIRGMEALVGLSMNSNALRQIPADTLPSSIEQMELRNCSLEHIPVDIARMAALADLDLSENNFTAATLNLSVLPVTLSTLALDALGFQAVPPNLQRLINLTALSLTDNAFKEFDVSCLPPQVQTLYIDRCSLMKFPARLNELKNLTTISAVENPITELQPGSFPATLASLTLLNAKVPKITAGVLPPGMTSLSLDSSRLVEMPQDLARMTRLSYLSLTNNSITKCELGDNLQTLAHIELGDNSLTKFSARLPVATYLSLSSNKLKAFEATKATKLNALYLDDNELEAVPSSVFNMTKLKVLVLAGNPIREYAPNVDEYTFLSKLSLLSMDQSQFASKCRGDRTKLLQGFRICEPRSIIDIETNAHDLTSSAKGRLSVLLNVLLVVVLVLTVVAAWHKRKLRKQKLDEMVKSGIAALRSKESNIWDDDVLLKHRLDAARVKRVRPLASGMYGDVWLAVYDKRKVAIKSLKEVDAPRELINNFVEEIKLLSTFSHPKVVRFVGVVWTKESDIAVVTEYMARGDLRSHLDALDAGSLPERSGTLSVASDGSAGPGPGPIGSHDATNNWNSGVIRIALDVTEALVYLHSLEPKLIHRDLKSRNVLLDSALNAKLSDFGVSRYKLDDDVTMTACVGTVRWVAPEVLAGDRYDESVDIFSLGVILSELDTHRLPYADARGDEGEPLSDLAIANLVLSGELTASFSATCPPAIRALALRCCAHDPKARPTAVQVAFELRALLLERHSSSTISLASTNRHGDDADVYDDNGVDYEDDDDVGATVNRDGMIVV